MAESENKNRQAGTPPATCFSISKKVKISANINNMYMGIQDQTEINIMGNILK